MARRRPRGRVAPRAPRCRRRHRAALAGRDGGAPAPRRALHHGLIAHDAPPQRGASARGQVVFELPHLRAVGATHLLLDPLELIEKLTLLIPPLRFHTLLFHGVLGAHGVAVGVIPVRPEAEEDPRRRRGSVRRGGRRCCAGCSPSTSWRVHAAAAGGWWGSTRGARRCGPCSSGWASTARRLRRSRHGRRRARPSSRTVAHPRTGRSPASVCRRCSASGHARRPATPGCRRSSASEPGQALLTWAAGGAIVVPRGDRGAGCDGDSASELPTLLMLILPWAAMI